MTSDQNTLASLFAACWKDDALKARFMNDPKFVLGEYGVAVPDGVDVNVVENSDSTVYITLPAAPEGHAGLSDEELGKAAGGWYGRWLLLCLQLRTHVMARLTTVVRT